MDWMKRALRKDHLAGVKPSELTDFTANYCWFASLYTGSDTKPTKWTKEQSRKRERENERAKQNRQMQKKCIVM